MLRAPGGANDEIISDQNRRLLGSKCHLMSYSGFKLESIMFGYLELCRKGQVETDILAIQGAGVAQKSLWTW